MDDATQISVLKQLLLKDVAYLCTRSDLEWSKAIFQTLRDIRDPKIKAVIFGGTLRSLLLTRLKNKGIGRPRDVDIVIAGASMETIRDRFAIYTKRETRFGGLQIERANKQFDMWPLLDTWAFKQDNIESPEFSTLPYTTFFNLEAIAVDVWAQPGHRRKIYSGDDQFFKGILEEKIEINREENPYPTLCVVRSLVMASSTGFAFGPRLARYLATRGATISDAELVDTQTKDYGRTLHSIDTLRRWLDYVTECYKQDNRSVIEIAASQLELWPEETKPSIIKFHILSDLGNTIS